MVKYPKRNKCEEEEMEMERRKEGTF